jgi:hypothetical protein
MNGASAWKHGVVDLAAILFVIGGVVSLVMTVLSIPISSLYPMTLPTSFTTVSIVILAITLICSLGAIHCYSLTTKRLLSEAGIRGIIFGALLLIFSLGMVGSLEQANVATSSAMNPLLTLSAVLILIAGAVCFGLRHTNVSQSGIARQHVISQPAFQS